MGMEIGHGVLHTMMMWYDMGRLVWVTLSGFKVFPYGRAVCCNNHISNSIVYVIQITRVNSHSGISMDILFDIVMEILH